MSDQLTPAQREAIGNISSLPSQSTVKAWQHATDPDRVLIAWPDGRTFVVNSGRYIEDDPIQESPDNWRPIGKHPAGTLRGHLDLGVALRDVEVQAEAIRMTEPKR